MSGGTRAPTQAGRGRGTAGGGAGMGTAKDILDLGPMYFNRAVVHVCLGDDASALDDLDHAVARDTRNIT